METEFDKRLLEAAKKMKIHLDGKAIECFQIFSHELIEWNKVMNLTAITEPSEIITRHFIDSLSVLQYFTPSTGASLIDVGCGAGFPGIPLKIARPDLKLTCLDSLNKRIQFIIQLVGKLELSDCSYYHMRAEEAGRKSEMREQFDVATARAVANLPMLCEYVLPLVKIGGCFIAMKGPDSEEECKKAETAVKKLGAQILKVEKFNLPDTDIFRTLIMIKKTEKTQEKYPRVSGKITKNPL